MAWESVSEEALCPTCGFSAGCLYNKEEQICLCSHDASGAQVVAGLHMHYTQEYGRLRRKTSGRKKKQREGYKVARTKQADDKALDAAALQLASQLRITAAVDEKRGELVIDASSVRRAAEEITRLVYRADNLIIDGVA